MLQYFISLSSISVKTVVPGTLRIRSFIIHILLLEVYLSINNKNQFYRLIIQKKLEKYRLLFVLEIPKHRLKSLNVSLLVGTFATNGASELLSLYDTMNNLCGQSILHL